MILYYNRTKLSISKVLAKCYFTILNWLDTHNFTVYVTSSHEGKTIQLYRRMVFKSPSHLLRMRKMNTNKRLKNCLDTKIKDRSFIFILRFSFNYCIFSNCKLGISHKFLYVIFLLLFYWKCFLIFHCDFLFNFINWFSGFWGVLKLCFCCSYCYWFLD